MARSVDDGEISDPVTILKEPVRGMAGSVCPEIHGERNRVTRKPRGIKPVDADRGITDGCDLVNVCNMVKMAVREHDLPDLVPVLFDSGREDPCIDEHFSDDICVP